MVSDTIDNIKDGFRKWTLSNIARIVAQGVPAIKSQFKADS